MRNTRKSGSRGLLILAGIAWLGLLAAGFTILEREEFTPAAGGRISSIFPARSAISLAADRLTFVMFLHPYCPCSRASLHELDELLAQTRNRLSVILVFTLPAGIPPGWEKSDLWTTASAMPGVRVLRDLNGVEARRFGVRASGHTLLYDPSGRLLFSGGITASRGHEGDNTGQSAITSLALTGHASIHKTPVFGCSLL